jgi:hypothetical protein
MQENAAPDTSPVDTSDTSAHEATIGEYVGRWNRLVSTTNWEKGRIINQWRAALRDEDAAVQEYSDEAWCRRVGGVSSQHVGRLRRVAERFGDSRDDYAGLFWSHFLAALDWSDAEMWLEGAVQNGWSVSRTRHQRWEALGGPADQRPRDEDVIAAEMDEDVVGALTGATGMTADANDPIVIPDAASMVHAADQLDAPAGGSEGGIEFDTAALGEGATHDPDAPQGGAGAEIPQPYRAFEQLGDLPEDMIDALESFKLAILRHKMGGWTEISSDDVLGVLDALRQLVLAPSE